jgi:hypothetical protein
MKNMLTGAAVWIASFQFTRDVSVAYIGVPLNVLVACAIGAFCSFSFSDRIEKRGTMVSLFVACLCMGAAFTALCNAALVHWLGLTMTDGLQAGLGAVVAFITRFFLPWLVDVVKNGKWLSWIPFIGRGDKG